MDVTSPTPLTSVTLRSVDITSQYDFTSDGKYYIRVDSPRDAHISYKDMMDTRIMVQLTGAHGQQQVLDEEHALRMAEKAERVSLIQAKTGVKRMKYKDNCSGAQRADIQKWVGKAKRWLDKAVHCGKYTGGYHCTENIKTWFNPKKSRK